MKVIRCTLLCLTLTAVARGQGSNPRYDSSLARKLGGDEYGMKIYTLVILKSGDNKTTEKRFTDSCFAGHMANINRLVKDGKLIVAGPLGKNASSYRGIFILNTGSRAAAEAMLAADPAVSSGLLAADLYEWYGSAALPEYLDASDRIWKKNH